MRGKERVFYFFDDTGANRMVWAFRFAEDGTQQTTFIPDVPVTNTPTEGILFDPGLGAAYTDPFLEPLITDEQRFRCGDCYDEKLATSCVDDNGNVRILVLEYLASTVTGSGFIPLFYSMRVAVYDNSAATTVIRGTIFVVSGKTTRTMKQPLLLFVPFFVFLQSAAQTRKNFELSPEKATAASSRIFHDGTFEIRFDNTVYSFDSEANQWREPVVAQDLLKKKQHLSVVDEELDIRYTIDPVLAGTGTAEARHPQVIRAEKLGGTGQFYQDIPYTIDEAWLPPKLAQESGFAWRMTNGDPAFVRFYTWTEHGEWQSKALQYILHLSDNSIEITHLMNGRVPLDKTLNTMAWGNVIGVVGGRLIFSVSYNEDFRLINPKYPEYVKTDLWAVDDAGRETKLHTIEVEIPLGAYWNSMSPVETNVQATGNALFFQHVYLRKVGSDDAGLFFLELHARVVEIDENMQVKEYILDIPWQDMLLYNPMSYQLLSCWQNGDERAFHIAVPDELGSTTVNIFRPTADSSYTMTFVPEVPFTKTSTEYAEVIFRPEAERGAALLDVVIHPEDVSRICRDCPRKKYATVRIAEDGTANILVLDLLLKGTDKITYARARYEQVLPLETKE